MRYQFTEDLVTGNNIIDSEHKILIKAADDFMQNIAKGEGNYSIQKTLSFLSDYTVTHFKHEEELQEESQYPDIAAHKEWHKGFAIDLQGTAEKVRKEGASSVALVELTRRISTLLNHIRTEDKRLASHINKK